ncbi:adenylate kinase [uncultured Bifidobacterium sp.]|uniref:adenylate kinase n=1 Tax=uncultured Bifidobacterium sp. TaxID=165187 RepID=UPI0028DB6D59|nr:adenylate kinase [uncultured Bifidobacterium sp.]
MRLLIMGPQGVGKGTQAALLSTHYGIPAISTGDIFRYNLKNHTPLGVKAQAYIDRGELVPDDLTNSIVGDRLTQADAVQGWILDGYPRNAAQVDALDAILTELGTPLDRVVALHADHDVLLARMSRRAKLEGRSDDTPDAIARRLDTYERETAPLLEVYRDRGQLLEVDGSGDAESISASIIGILG